VEVEAEVAQAAARPALLVLGVHALLNAAGGVQLNVLALHGVEPLLHGAVAQAHDDDAGDNVNGAGAKEHPAAIVERGGDVKALVVAV